MNRLDDGPPMKRQHTRRQSRLEDTTGHNGHCKHADSGYCKHPETQRNIRRCKYAIRTNKPGEDPCVACEREL